MNPDRHSQWIHRLARMILNDTNATIATFDKDRLFEDVAAAVALAEQLRDGESPPPVNPQGGGPIPSDSVPG